MTERNSLSILFYSLSLSPPLLIRPVICSSRIVWFSYFSFNSSMNLLFLLFFSRAETGFTVLSTNRFDLTWDLDDFLSPSFFYLFLSILILIFSFLWTYLLATGMNSLRELVIFKGVLASLGANSLILLDFFLLDLGLTDSVVGLLLIFFDSFLGISFGTSRLPDLIIVDLLLFPSPPFWLTVLIFRFDILARTSTSFSSSSEITSSFFLALVAFLCRSVEMDLFCGRCFLSYTRVLVRFFSGVGIFLAGTGLVSTMSAWKKGYAHQVQQRHGRGVSDGWSAKQVEIID